MRRHRILTLLAFQSLLGLAAQAASFDCGSTGTYGPMNIVTNTTLNLPPDGIFNCTTITVASNATLRFTNNALNTPVYLLAAGEVTVEGTIDVSGWPSIGGKPGKGGPGGFDGGYGGSYFSGQAVGGDGLGPGGGRNIPGWYWGTYGKTTTYWAGGSNTNTYGNLLLSPLLGGSGGAGGDGSPGVGGGGGGGAILIASNERINVPGTVRSAGVYGSASGGAIRLVSPVISGSGLLDVCGSELGAASYGRIRIDCQDNQAYRSLNLFGLASRGTRMVVFPAVQQYLDIIEVASNPIPEGTNNSVLFELPNGASTNQTVTVQARNFTNDVAIRVVVTPENGPRGEFDAVILQASGNPPFTNVPVVIPAGHICHIQAWTR